MTDVLIEFRHGLGDAVQLTSVLRHLRRERPDWVIDVASLIGKSTAFRGLCRNSYVVGRDSFNHIVYQDCYFLAWDECWTAYADFPSTKVSLCLRDVFGIQPQPEDCLYSIDISDEARAAADEYLRTICPAGRGADGRFPVMFIHYQGNTSTERKNLNADFAADACRAAIACGLIPVVFDWDHRSPLPDNQTIFNPGPNHPLWLGVGTGDAERIAALIEASALMVGVDSGPLHVAGATSTPTIAVWLRHHPAHYFDLCPNVLHLVPNDIDVHARGPDAHRYFLKNYRHKVYAGHQQLSEAICGAIRQQCGVEEIQEPPPLLEMYAGRYLYRRVGHDERMMQFEADGLISEGAAGCEQRWFPRIVDGSVVIDLFGAHGVICSCRQTGELFAGAWNKFEKMPIELLRQGG